MAEVKFIGEAQLIPRGWALYERDWVRRGAWACPVWAVVFMRAWVWLRDCYWRFASRSGERMYTGEELRKALDDRSRNLVRQYKQKLQFAQETAWELGAADENRSIVEWLKLCEGGGNPPIRVPLVNPFKAKITVEDFDE